MPTLKEASHGDIARVIGDNYRDSYPGNNPDMANQWAIGGLSSTLTFVYLHHRAAFYHVAPDLCRKLDELYGVDTFKCATCGQGDSLSGSCPNPDCPDPVGKEMEFNADAS